jgi:hypothetical protein
MKYKTLTDGLVWAMDSKFGQYSRVIGKVLRPGGENGQFWHNGASNAELVKKILTKRNNCNPN